jgi:hypothetical protein
MEETLPTQDFAQAEQKGKRTVERSAAYPGISIEDAIRFCNDIYKNFRNAFAKRNDIIDLIEGSHPRHLAAASHYGLLNREKDTYQVSNLFKDIVIHPTGGEIEKQKLLLEAFGNPNLNRELINKFDGDELPKELIAHLSKFHRITPEAAPLAADVFVKNGKYCGVLDDRNVLNYKNTILKLSDPNFQYAEVIDEKSKSIDAENTGTPATGVTEIEKPIVTKQQEQSTSQLLLTEMIGEERVKVRLTGKKFAYLIYPEGLTKIDVQILKKEIEQLELTVE